MLWKWVLKPLEALAKRSLKDVPGMRNRQQRPPKQRKMKGARA